MSAAEPTRRVVKRGAAEPARCAPSLAERLEEWLVLWGDWVRAYQANTVARKSEAPRAWRDLPSARQWESTLEVLESLRLEDRTLRELDACVSDLAKLHYLALHWQYARAFRRGGPAIVRHQQLPDESSVEYSALLDDARAALARQVVARHVLIPE